MNWKRIWTGAACATGVIALFDFFTLRFGTSNFSLLGLTSVILLSEAFVQGFFCSAFYAVARPRLGPGPKTAIIVGTALYLIKYGLGLIWMLAPGIPVSAAFLHVIIGWGKFVLATYLAGWQYIEKAP